MRGQPGAMSGESEAPAKESIQKIGFQRETSLHG